MAKSAASGLFDGIKNAKATRDANYFRDGRYIWLIQRVKADVNRKKVRYVAIECKVVYVFDDDDAKGHKVGEEAACLYMSDNDVFLNNVKAFVANIVGCSEDDIEPEACEALCDDDQPLAGWFAESHNRTLIGSKSGKPFCKVSWKRSWSNNEVKALLDEETLSTLFPEGLADSDE